MASMMTNGWSGQYDNFKDYAEQKLGIGYRKAAYCANIYSKLVESGIAWEKVKGIGWTKLMTLLPVITNENADQWVADIQAGDLTVLQLQSMVKEAQAPSTTGEANTASVSTLTFKAHDDQKATIKEAIAKAKEVSGTSVDTVALEYIAMDYLGNAEGKSAIASGAALAVSEEAPTVAELVQMFSDSDDSIVELFTTKGWEHILGLVEKAFPNLEMNVTVPE